MSSHAASRPRTPPAAPTPPAPAPAPVTSATPWRPQLRRALLFALGLLVAGGVAAAGWAISTTTAPREDRPAASRAVAVGPAVVAVPAEWQPEDPSASGVAELPDRAVAFATVPGLEAHAVVAVVRAGRSPSARVALERLLGPLGSSRPSRTAGRPARTYAARPLEGDRVVEATLAPTAAGTLVVLCVAKSASWAGASGCAGDLGAA